MIVLSNTMEQLLNPGEAMTFDRVLIKHGCGISHRANTGSVTLRGRRPYKIEFHGNLTGTAGDLVLGIYADGALLPETTMGTALATTDDLSNVSAGTIVGNFACCIFDSSITLTVANAGAVDLTIAPNAVLIVEEV